MRVLIIEDESALRASVAERLRGAGYAVDEAGDGDEGLWFAREYPQDLAIVDLGLPGTPGMDVIRTLREDGVSYPILVLTARGRWEDKVDGLGAGADDYLVKPFHMEELMARVQALLRRAGGWSHPLLTSGPVRLDTRSQEVHVDDRRVELTGFEFRVLECLLMHAGDVVSKTELTERIYEQDFERDSNVIEVFVGRLRKKLDPDGAIKPIETLRGRGYRWTLPRDSQPA